METIKSTMTLKQSYIQDDAKSVLVAKKEELLWKNAGIALPDKKKWYVQTGQEMLATINETQKKNR